MVPKNGSMCDPAGRVRPCRPFFLLIFLLELSGNIDYDRGYGEEAVPSG